MPLVFSVAAPLVKFRKEISGVESCLRDVEFISGDSMIGCSSGRHNQVCREVNTNVLIKTCNAQNYRDRHIVPFVTELHTETEHEQKDRIRRHEGNQIQRKYEQRKIRKNKEM